VRSYTWGVGLILAVCILGEPPAGARAAPPPAPTSEPAPAGLSLFERAFLRVYQDAKGHTVAWWHDDPSGETWVFYGLAPASGPIVMYRQRIEGSGGDAHAYSATFWEPRFRDGWQRSFGVKDGQGEVQCGERKSVLAPLPAAKAAALMASARLLEHRWQRSAYLLVRDDHGVYTYIDKQAGVKEARTFRLYHGKKGEMKALPMLNVVSDASGDIFGTKEGELRLVVDHTVAGEEPVRKPFWIKGKGKTELTTVDLWQSGPLIYRELGVYEGQLLGTPCDDL
jgi:hypothetical protein